MGKKWYIKEIPIYIDRVLTAINDTWYLDNLIFTYLF